MTALDRAETVRRLYAAFVADDRTTAESLIAPGFTFSSPYDDALDRDAYFARCWPNGGKIEQITIERLLVEGDAAFVVYKASAPGGRTFRNAEVLTFDGRLVATVEVYFGAERIGGTFSPKG
ncbi:nuclear transport factor 2 family protein [Chelatococcus sambhunathii]|uniref:Nuclear transport factor 2 family protein n=1 Tax=Chelatococcus sambhunathii TaxID=363953 RepID=A0ABU1DHR0_9HYPH|nr:nuclear transport factor 2 family protein [Chelatococcus sambhunathii]MDR4307629.1 nuclear transport factor 2 family protein [Chelatococcus sambhunathii]